MDVLLLMQAAAQGLPPVDHSGCVPAWILYTSFAGIGGLFVVCGKLALEIKRLNESRLEYALRGKNLVNGENDEVS